MPAKPRKCKTCGHWDNNVGGGNVEDWEKEKCRKFPPPGIETGVVLRDLWPIRGGEYGCEHWIPVSGNS